MSRHPLPGSFFQGLQDDAGQGRPILHAARAARLVAGANGFLGRFLLLDLLKRVAAQ